jgi:hypothetical protein
MLIIKTTRPIETKSDTQIVLEELQIYRKAQMAILNPANTKSRMDLSVEAIDGDRSGHVHIKINITFCILKFITYDNNFPKDKSILYKTNSNR